MRRPLIAIPGRFSASASALRFGAVVNARKLLESVYRAGGEPLTVLPDVPHGAAQVQDVSRRLAWADGVLLPGGGDLDPSCYGQPAESEELYDIDADQDAFDMAVARWAIGNGRPLLAICRGLHVVNAARGGDLEQHMAVPHRHVTHQMQAVHPMLAEVVGGQPLAASCYHHQRVRRLAPGLTPAALASDGTIEAVVDESAASWFAGVQWHPEDTSDVDPRQLELFRAFVRAAGSAGSAGGARSAHSRVGLQRHDDLAQR